MSITTERIVYRYDRESPAEEAVLKGVSAEIKEGLITAIMGKTGCGKSTLIQVMAGLLDAESGRVMVDGEDICDRGFDRTALRAKLGVVFQYPEKQLFETTVAKDVGFGLKHLDMTDEEKRANIRWALEIMGFDPDEVGGKSPLGLSGGEKRRLAIAGVLAIRPKYLILDEPVAGLDPFGREKFIHLLKKLKKDGTGIAIVSHNADMVAECADRVIIMSDGEITMTGDTKDVFRDMESVAQAGVDVSAARRIAHALNVRGIGISRDTIRYDDLISEIVRVSERGGK
jgi:energy-coupling factor transport system ATP-binding protein